MLINKYDARRNSNYVTHYDKLHKVECLYVVIMHTHCVFSLPQQLTYCQTSKNKIMTSDSYTFTRLSLATIGIEQKLYKAIGIIYTR